MCISTTGRRARATSSRLRRIVRQRRHVVDDARRRRRARRAITAAWRVSIETRSPRSAQRRDHRQDARAAPRRRDRRGAGPRRFAADVDDVGARLASARGHAAIAASGVEEVAAVGEAVGRHVDHAHERGRSGEAGEGRRGAVSRARSSSRDGHRRPAAPPIAAAGDRPTDHARRAAITSSTA